jgi:hypothetical protein
MSAQPESGHGASGAPGADQVRAHLRRILESPAFRSSKRSQAFLEYAVEKVLAGEQDALKERNIAVDVFGRLPDTNLNEDTIVRVGAREVRRRLAQYHTLPEAANDEIHIDLPAGSYVPEWHAQGVQRTGTQTAQAAIPLRRPARGGHWMLAAAGAAALAAAAYLAWPPDAFVRFWKPFTSGGNVLIATAHPTVFHLSSRALSRDRQRPGYPFPFIQHAPEAPPGEINGADLVAVRDQYVGFGDMVAAAELTRMLGTAKVNARLRMATQADFSDLRETPLILIGAYTNRWTMELTKGYRFRFSVSGGKPAIEEAGGQRVWSLPVLNDDGTSREDFVLISRVLTSPTGKPLISAAGLKQFGTEAAGHILTDAGHLDAILGKTPAGWEKKNLQILLHVQVIGNSPSAPEIVAVHLW